MKVSSINFTFNVNLLIFKLNIFYNTERIRN